MKGHQVSWFNMCFVHLCGNVMLIVVLYSDLNIKCQSFVEAEEEAAAGT